MYVLCMYIGSTVKLDTSIRSAGDSGQRSVKPLNLPPQPTVSSSAMSAGQEFAVSAAAAGLSHIIHHPLYTLKSQMMYYGPKFRFKEFFEQARTQRGSFLYRGLCTQGRGHGK